MPTASDGSAPPAGAWDLRVLAPAKINLGLVVLKRREDGFHEIRTVFQAVDLEDELLLRRRREPGLALRVEGSEGGPGRPEAATVPGDARNLAVRAGEALALRRHPRGGAELLLRKRIPVGSGLGGGSSDAAAALVGLEALWGLDPDPEELRRLALAAGSDVPFFLHGGTALGEGRGERLTPLPAPPVGGFVLALPGFAVLTGEAYRGVRPGLTRSCNRFRMLQIAIRKGDLEAFVENLVNDLEPPVFASYPALPVLRDRLMASGAAAVTMTGSGSTLVALTRTMSEAEALAARFPAGGPGLQGFDVRLCVCRPLNHGVQVLPAGH